MSGGGLPFPQRRNLLMPHDRPAPQTRIADDDTQDDWAADLFVAPEEQGAQGESDDQDEQLASVGDMPGTGGTDALPFAERLEPFALTTAPQLRPTPRSYQREAVDA